ncbi:ABC-type spermidine/putrescine transport system, permease component II [Desulfotomaculum arcticum]|uniref:ABC-type spermidine/putrescine transport system, permease component II n=1 Tax=Desulfotruncus arcticus DSM 17038 TaxID=1121424 RepID=A0A1I2QJG1_9FIRM|nr:ABC transporter permease subunit [Desulfotruncus arcticus]SFG28735.1 ABC-type spermidine/putrescine transport system, permease component II [Desulfotomaculum arcticum] [Desulfotruncus arcticus DSM 17038]
MNGGPENAAAAGRLNSKKRVKALGTTIGAVYTALVYAIIYLPIGVLVAFSFNRSKINAVWQGFTLDWYRALFHDRLILEAAKNTLIIGITATIISTMIGTLAAVGMYRYHFRGKSVLDSLLYIPIVIPEVVLGISLLALFAIFKVRLGLNTLILSHITFCIPFVVVTVKARLAGFDRNMEEAAMDLGASQWQTFVKVTLPLIMPGVAAGALLAFTLSIDDVIISFFVAGPGSTTLPLKIYAMVKQGVTPAVNALSTIMLLLTFIVTIAAEGLRSRAN